MQPEVLRCFIGYDPRQPVSFTVLANSIMMRSSVPVSITPLIIEQLPIERVGLTPFTFSRFLVPWLCDFQGWGLFLDADIILQDDIKKLFDIREDKYAVMVSKNKLKFEWASVMLFNCAKCDMLTPDYVEKAKGMHTINFVETDAVGELPGNWNHLVGYDRPRDDASLVHYTQGVPAWPETNDCEYAKQWHEDLHFSVAAQSWEKIMGQSVHAAMDAQGKKVPLYKINRATENA